METKNAETDRLGVFALFSIMRSLLVAIGFGNERV